MSKSVESRLGNIEGKLDLLLEASRGNDQRLRKVENRMAWYAGASSVLGMLFGGLLTAWMRAKL